MVNPGGTAGSLRSDSMALGVVPEYCVAVPSLYKTDVHYSVEVDAFGGGVVAECSDHQHQKYFLYLSTL